MTSRIYTRTGDTGETGLFGGERVPKDHVRVSAYGTVDELNSVLGVALALELPEAVSQVVTRLQSLLFELGAELATPPNKTSKSLGVTEEDIVWMERAIDAAEADLPPLRSFILPGGVPSAAMLHQARTVCRRAERLVVKLHRLEANLPLQPVKALNRMADLLFVLARQANHLSGRGDVPWHPRPAG